MVQAFPDNGDHYMTNPPIIQRVSQRISPCAAPCDQDLIMFIRDITQAYLQPAKIIIIILLIQPAPRLHLGPHKLLRLIGPL